MNVGSTLLWGFLATVVMAITTESCQGLGLSRMSMPLILGTMFTPDRRKAPIYGFLAHLVNGWAFAFVYALVFESLGRATWWIGAILGAIHGLATLLLLVPLIPGLHPRMASETTGPEPTRALEPPGFMALNYGRRTPAITIAAHVLYGVVMGLFYRLAG